MTSAFDFDLQRANNASITTIKHTITAGSVTSNCQESSYEARDRRGNKQNEMLDLHQRSL